ncbi:ABC transporter permease [Mesorhizobium sp. CN2-181]|uniref:ABC transporter permease n=1 Tax=Mesorhizobium yinganensis TaxID=3157707 RepID=UPI0032B81C7E
MAIQHLQRQPLALAGLLLAGVLFMLLSGRGFGSTYNLYVLLAGFSITMLVALSQLIVLAIGQTNLATGSIGALGAIIAGGLMQELGVAPFWSCSAAVVAGGLAGAVNGVVVNLTRLNSFIVTLATFAIYRGLVYAVTEAQPYYGLPEGFKEFGIARWGAVPVMFVPVVLILVGLIVFFGRMRFGRAVLATGANQQGARLGLLPVAGVVLFCHVLSGLLAALAGIVTAARLQSAWPTVGDTWLLTSFAAPILGGTALSGGKVSVVGAALGVAVIALAENALILYAVDPYWFQLAIGALLFGTVVATATGSRGTEFAR